MGPSICQYGVPGPGGRCEVGGAAGLKTFTVGALVLPVFSPYPPQCSRDPHHNHNPPRPPPLLMSQRSSPSISPIAEYELGTQLAGAAAPLTHLVPVNSTLDPTTQRRANIVPLQDFFGLLSFPAFGGPTTATPHASPRTPPSPSPSPPGEISANRGNPSTVMKHPSPKGSLSPCFTRTPLARHPRPPDSSPVQAPSRREKKAKEKSAPYDASALTKRRREMTPVDDLDAWYTALVDDAVKDPKYRFYRREVIDKAVRGADYRKPKAKRRRQGTASSRQRAPEPGSTLPSTANTSHALPLRSGHDHSEVFPQQEVSEREPLVHSSTPIRIIDNRGHPVSGIPTRGATAANPSSPASSIPSVNEGLECDAIRLAQSG